MQNTNIITIESNIPIPALMGRNGVDKYGFVRTLEITNSFHINGNTPDFKPVSVRAHIYKLNITTDRKYTIRTLEGPSVNPISIRVWRIA